MLASQVTILKVDILLLHQLFTFFILLHMEDKQRHVTRLFLINIKLTNTTLMKEKSQYVF